MILDVKFLIHDAKGSQWTDEMEAFHSKLTGFFSVADDGKIHRAFQNHTTIIFASQLPLFVIAVFLKWEESRKNIILNILYWIGK